MIKQPPSHYCGFQIVQSHHIRPLIPKLELNPDFEYCTSEFRGEINDWLYEMFGGRGMLFYRAGDKIITHPDNVNALVQAFENKNY